MLWYGGRPEFIESNYHLPGDSRSLVSALSEMVPTPMALLDQVWLGLECSDWRTYWIDGELLHWGDCQIPYLLFDQDPFDALGFSTLKQSSRLSGENRPPRLTSCKPNSGARTSPRSMPNYSLSILSACPSTASPNRHLPCCQLGHALDLMPDRGVAAGPIWKLA